MNAEITENGQLVASERTEVQACERGTAGCCVAHDRTARTRRGFVRRTDFDGCEAW